jgi:hypothetical protein
VAHASGLAAGLKLENKIEGPCTEHCVLSTFSPGLLTINHCNRARKPARLVGARVMSRRRSKAREAEANPNFASPPSALIQVSRSSGCWRTSWRLRDDRAAFLVLMAAGLLTILFGAEVPRQWLMLFAVSFVVIGHLRRWGRPAPAGGGARLGQR